MSEVNSELHPTRVKHVKVEEEEEENKKKKKKKKKKKEEEEENKEKEEEDEEGEEEEKKKKKKKKKKRAGRGSNRKRNLHNEVLFSWDHSDQIKEVMSRTCGVLVARS